MIFPLPAWIIVVWWIVGYVLSIIVMAKRGNIAVGDILIACITAFLGPLNALLLLDLNKVIWRKK
jgi:hypothetical protein